MLRSVTFAAAVAAMALAAPASATTPGAKTTKVTYQDLDLSTAEGVRALKSRVRDAAKDVCDMNEAWKTRNLTRAQICMRTAMSGAQPQVKTAVAMFEKNVRRAEAAAAVTVAS